MAFSHFHGTAVNNSGLNINKLLYNIHKKNQNLYYIYQKIEGRFVTKILKYKLYKVSELEHYIILREKLTV